MEIIDNLQYINHWRFEPSWKQRRVVSLMMEALRVYETSVYYMVL
jgi:hypothetical protein